MYSYIYVYAITHSNAVYLFIQIKNVMTIITIIYFLCRS